MKRLDGKSLDILSENVTKLKQIFPEVFSEGKVDFEKLHESLGEFTDTSSERYNFTWNGKQNTKKIAQTPSTGTLRPAKEESKNWDTTQNLYIEGDNLEVLKLLQKSYHKKVKMIYIDPPYNTGKDFVYKDNFKENIKNYLEQTGQVDSDGNKLSTNSKTNGRYHSDWLNMMYPIRRAGEKIKIDYHDKDLSTLDIGFKVFKLDSSNIKEWDSDFDNLEVNLLDVVDNIKENRTSEDLLLKYGLDLTLPIEEKLIQNKKVFVIGYGALIVCLDDEITTDVVEQIAKLKDEYQSSIMRVVFKDGSFKDAVVKTNALQILKQFGIDKVVSV